MQFRRWLALVAIAPTLMLMLTVLFVVGSWLGLKDTPAVRFALAGTAVLSGLIGWWLAGRLPVRHAAWSLPVGVGVAMAIWLPVTSTTGLTPAVAVAVLLAWAAALTVVSGASVALGRRSTLAASLLAVVGAVAIVVLVPAFAVRVGAGAAMLAPESLATWAPALVSDETYSLGARRRPAAELASTFAVLVVTGTSYLIGYVAGLGRASGTPAPAAAPTTTPLPA